MLDMKKMEIESSTENRPTKETVIRAENIHTSFGGQNVLNGISFELHKGEIVLLRGDNGSGKTTLLNILTGYLSPDKGSLNYFSGAQKEFFSFPISAFGKMNPFPRFSPERLCKSSIFRSWQDIRLFSTLNILDNVILATQNHPGESPLGAIFGRKKARDAENNARNNARENLGHFGLADRSKSSADKISIGQAKRVSLARAVQAGAKVLFLDEPLSGLDENGIADFLKLLKKLISENSITLVIVEHIFNVQKILDFSTTVWTLKDGKLTLNSSKDPEIINAISSQKESVCNENWINKLLKPGYHQKCIRFNNGAELIVYSSDDNSGIPVLEIRDLVALRGRRLVIGTESENGKPQGISFTIGQKDVAILKAPNGWGKTTLLETLTGLNSDFFGSVKLNSTPIEKYPPWRRFASGISLLRSRDNQFPDLTVRENLRLSRILYPSDHNIEILLSRPVSSLSGGEKQKLGLECVVYSRQNGGLLMLDEPFSSLDSSSIGNSLEKLSDLVGKTAILIAIPAA